MHKNVEDLPRTDGEGLSKKIIGAMSQDACTALSDISYVFLDRDGVLNRKPRRGQFVTRWEEFELLPGVDDAIAKLNRSGRKVIVVTNQRGVALGLYSMEELEWMHGLFQELLTQRGARLDGIYVCPHNDGQCNCRKPLTGLFEQAFQDFPGARPENSVMVGDSLRDIEAGMRMGMRTVFVIAEGGSWTVEAARARRIANLCVASLAELVDHYLSGEYHP